MSRVRLPINAGLTWFHRWAGVVLCAFFAMWFATGAVLHFVGFPSLPPAEQAAAAEPIDLAQIRVLPAAAFASQPSVQRWRLVSADGKPEYVAEPDHGPSLAVGADTGLVLPPIDAAAARRIAERFGAAAAAGVTGPLDTDQWIVHQRFDAHRPFYRVSLADERGTDLYVSARSGEVLQRTRATERAWNWAGAVTHWIYFTALRRSWAAWNQVVWWGSLAGLLAALAGFLLGWVRFADQRRSVRRGGRPGWSPFRGWMRWHHVIGLIVGVIVIGWILSGWLSMDHGRLFSRGEASRADLDALRGETVAQIGRDATAEVLAALGPVSVVGFDAAGGHTLVSAARSGTGQPRTAIVDPAGIDVVDAVPDVLLLQAVLRLSRGTTVGATPADDVDRLYRLAESVPEDAAGFLLEPAGLRIYIDRHSGRILAWMDGSRRAYAWIYYALHTLQVPGLLGHEALRTGVMVTLLALGFLFSATGVMLGWLRLRREFRS